MQFNLRMIKILLNQVYSETDCFQVYAGFSVGFMQDRKVNRT